ncbi:hypothetical protein [Streptomyces sp. NRRL S-244]|uniref:hypothetical protein n=1 Tax=Streptomyces sp. NRRL S-244 TaxID=1463897 RepID=UPI0004BF20E3|nr:hypothetical protein [Streptomyces sp. NRRL S-244]
MPAQEIPTLKSQYAEKVAADLDLNTAEQERIREEITSLQQRLAGLEQDHALLVGMRSALGDIATAVPAPRTAKKTATNTTAKNTTAKKATTKKAAGRKTTAVKAAAKAPVKAAAKEPAKAKAAAPQEKAAAPKEKAVASKEKQVPLTELIHRHLSGQAEPKTAREIAQALKTAHPDRSVSDNLVRTTTERLVARSLAERVKQGATVYYTALPHHGEAGEAPATTDEAAAGEETENAPVPATA